jgi:long-chain fatty acid transport protein
MKLRKKNVSIMIVILALPALAGANGLNLNGLGSRALSMGGAFVAVADDFSTIYWNPAGAASFKRPTAGLNVFDLIPSETYRYGTPPNYLIDAKSEPAQVLGGLVSFYQPVSSRVVVGFGISTPSGMGGEWNVEGLAPFSGGILYKWSATIGVLSFSPLVAVKISDIVSAGLTFNINYGRSRMSTIAGVYELPEMPRIPVDLGQYEEKMGGWGYGATLGVLVAPSSTYRLGLTVRTPFTIKFKGTGITSHFPLYDVSGTSDMERDFTWPLCIAAGVAVWPISRLLIAVDIQWSHWSTLERNITLYKDPYWAQFWGAEGYDDILMAWEDKIQIRFGGEYALSPVLALRVGYCYDPAPSPDKTMNLLLPSYTYNTFTLGISYIVSGWKIDAGLEYMSGKDRIIEYSGYNDPGTFGMRMIIPSISVSFEF